MRQGCTELSLPVCSVVAPVQKREYLLEVVLHTECPLEKAHSKHVSKQMGKCSLKQVVHRIWGQLRGGVEVFAQGYGKPFATVSSLGARTWRAHCIRILDAANLFLFLGDATNERLGCGVTQMLPLITQLAPGSYITNHCCPHS